MTLIPLFRCNAGNEKTSVVMKNINHLSFLTQSPLAMIPWSVPKAKSLHRAQPDTKLQTTIKSNAVEVSLIVHSSPNYARNRRKPSSIPAGRITRSIVPIGRLLGLVIRLLLERTPGLVVFIRVEFIPVRLRLDAVEHAQRHVEVGNVIA